MHLIKYKIKLKDSYKTLINETRVKYEPIIMSYLKVDRTDRSHLEVTVASAVTASGAGGVH